MLADRDTTADRLAEAEQSLAKTVERMGRVKRDYLDGSLPADDYAEFKALLEGEHAAGEAEVAQLRARAGELATALGQTDVDAAVRRVMARIGEVLADTERIEHTRNIIRSIWPVVTVHHDGDEIRLETGPVAAGFATALGSTTDYEGLAMMSSPPRSSTRMRWMSSGRWLSTMIGVSGSAVSRSPERMPSTRSSVCPLTSTMINCGCSTDSTAIALARSSAALIR